MPFEAHLRRHCALLAVNLGDEGRCRTKLRRLRSRRPPPTASLMTPKLAAPGSTGQGDSTAILLQVDLATRDGLLPQRRANALPTIASEQVPPSRERAVPQRRLGSPPGPSRSIWSVTWTRRSIASIRPIECAELATPFKAQCAPLPCHVYVTVFSASDRTLPRPAQSPVRRRVAEKLGRPRSRRPVAADSLLRGLPLPPAAVATMQVARDEQATLPDETRQLCQRRVVRAARLFVAQVATGHVLHERRLRQSGLQARTPTTGAFPGAVTGRLAVRKRHGQRLASGGRRTCSGTGALWSCPDWADRFDCLNQRDGLVSNSMGVTSMRPRRSCRPTAASRPSGTPWGPAGAGRTPGDPRLRRCEPPGSHLPVPAHGSLGPHPDRPPKNRAMKALQPRKYCPRERMDDWPVRQLPTRQQTCVASGRRGCCSGRASAASLAPLLPAAWRRSYRPPLAALSAPATSRRRRPSWIVADTSQNSGPAHANT